MSYWKEDGTALKMWEWAWFSEDGDDGTIRAVPGGWGVENYKINTASASGGYFVPDPTAPHCQPVPTDAPPMTDEALAKWCDAMLGQPEPISADRNGARWKYDDTFVYYEPDEPADERWAVPWCDYGLPASIAGPALWAAHKHGSP